MATYFKANSTILGGTINNTVIGATTAAAITGTTITGSSLVAPSLDYAGALALGGTNATSLAVGKTGVVTSVLGGLKVQSVIDTTAAGALNIGTTTATSINIGQTGVTTQVAGNLIVTGTTTSIMGNNIMYTDPNVFLGANYIGTAARKTGVSMNVSTTTATGTAYTNITTVNTFVVASHTFVAGDIIQSSGSSVVSNDGVYEVASVTATTVVINATPANNWCQTTLVNGGTGTITKVNMAVLQYNASTSAFEMGYGNTASMAYTSLLTAANGVQSSNVGTATANALVKWNGTGGLLIQNSGAILDASNNLTGLANLSATGNVALGSASSNLSLISAGKDILLGSVWSYLNNNYTTAANINTGMVFNYNATFNSTAASGGFASTTTVKVASSTNYTIGKFLSVSGAVNPLNNGFYELAAPVDGTTVQIKSSPTYSFCKSAFVVSTTDTVAQLAIVNVAVLQVNGGTFQVASGSTSAMTFASVATSSGPVTYTSENLSAATAATAVNPSLSTDITYVSLTSGSAGNATGTLAAGTNGQIKTIALVACNATAGAGNGYQLTVTACLSASDALGATPASHTFTLNSVGQSIVLCYSTAISGWVIHNTGALIA